MCAVCGCGQKDKSHPKYGSGPKKGKMIKKAVKKAATKKEKK